jgi:TctA family transporter
MEELNNLFGGFAVAMTLPNILYMLIGITLGVLIGVLPGLGGANGIAILLPLTFTMNPTSAIIMLSCIYWGALFGGAITSILFNIPGEPWSVATTFDGYPMAQQGRAAQALTAAFTSSFIGAFFAVALITFLAPVLAKFALNFGPAEYFAVQLLTFCSFVGMSKEPPTKVIVAMMLGFALAAVGMDTVTGQLRMTYGFPVLLKGFDFLIAVIGLFGIGEILLTMEEGLAFKGKREDKVRYVRTFKDTALLEDIEKELCMVCVNRKAGDMELQDERICDGMAEEDRKIQDAACWRWDKEDIREYRVTSADVKEVRSAARDRQRRSRARRAEESA